MVLTLVSVSIASALFALWRKPDDPYNQELNKQFAATLDSLTLLRDSATKNEIALQSPEQSQLQPDSVQPPARLYRAESQYQKKELPTSVININSAGKEQLMKLPGVGEKMAERIIAYRKQSPFATPADLMNVSGIGEKKFEKMKPYVKVK